VQGLEDEESYIQYIRESESIELDKTAIQMNASKRGLDELYINQF
jgi:hypothetical protein